VVPPRPLAPREPALPLPVSEDMSLQPHNAVIKISAPAREADRDRVVASWTISGAPKGGVAHLIGSADAAVKRFSEICCFPSVSGLNNPLRNLSCMGRTDCTKRASRPPISHAIALAHPLPRRAPERAERIDSSRSTAHHKGRQS
jgi:hypothetical protein